MKLAIIFLLLSFSSIAKEGRYQLVKGEKQDEDRLVDTEAGKIWKRSCAAVMKKAGVCSAYVWLPEPIQGVSSKKELDDYFEREQSVAKSADESIN